MMLMTICKSGCTVTPVLPIQAQLWFFRWTTRHYVCLHLDIDTLHWATYSSQQNIETKYNASQSHVGTCSSFMQQWHSFLFRQQFTTHVIPWITWSSQMWYDAVFQKCIHVSEKPTASMSGHSYTQKMEEVGSGKMPHPRRHIFHIHCHKYLSLTPNSTLQYSFHEQEVDLCRLWHCAAVW
jgi:hypothetical protein